MANFRYAALVIGAVTTPQSALVWIRDTFGSLEDEPTEGHAVAIRSTQPGPAELYPSVLYTWLRWWTDQTRIRLPAGDRTSHHVPQPPEHLVAHLHGTRLTLTIRAAELDTSGGWGRTLAQHFFEPFDPEDPFFR